MPPGAVRGARRPPGRAGRAAARLAAEARVDLSFGFKQQIKQVRSGQISAGTQINDNELDNTQYGTLTTSQLAAVARQGAG